MKGILFVGDPCVASLKFPPDSNLMNASSTERGTSEHIDCHHFSTNCRMVTPGMPVTASAAFSSLNQFQSFIRSYFRFGHESPRCRRQKCDQHSLAQRRRALGYLAPDRAADLHEPHWVPELNPGHWAYQPEPFVPFYAFSQTTNDCDREKTQMCRGTPKYPLKRIAPSVLTWDWRTRVELWMTSLRPLLLKCAAGK